MRWPSSVVRENRFTCAPYSESNWLPLDSAFHIMRTASISMKYSGVQEELSVRFTTRLRAGMEDITYWHTAESKNSLSLYKCISQLCHLHFFFFFFTDSLKDFIWAASVQQK